MVESRLVMSLEKSHKLGRKERSMGTQAGLESQSSTHNKMKDTGTSCEAGGKSHHDSNKQDQRDCSMYV